MTTSPDAARHDDRERERDDERPEAEPDPIATTEDPAANMDNEGDTPN
ncbi:hypothetical protein ABZ319_03765 [Nocardia sp. NPDC005978]